MSRDSLELVLSDARTAPLPEEHAPLAPATPLSDAEVAALLGRLPALPDAPTTTFQLRRASTPPPRPGATVAAPWPPPPGDPPPEAAPQGPLAVLRHQPDGEVPLVPSVAITFDRPMVPLTTHAQAAGTVPVTLEPQPEGTWRWVGTRTLIFEPATARLPMATTYTLSVRPDARALDGSSLAAPFVASFATPPPDLVESVPSGTTSRTPVIALVFDQAVDDAAIRDVVRVRAGGRDVEVRLARSEEIADDERARALADRTDPDRLVALVPVSPLPGNTEVVVTLPPGTPSAEGPRTTTEARRLSFRTFGPLALARSHCGNPERACRPGNAFVLEFTNDLDRDVDPQTLVTIEPEIDEPVFTIYGRYLRVHGATEPNTAYRVTVGPELRDVFGQTLGKPARTTFRVGTTELSPQVWIPGGAVIVPDPTGAPVVTAAVGGVASARVRVTRVTPEDWPLHFQRDFRRNADPPLLGTPLLDETRSVPDGRHALQPVEVDLSPFTHEGGGLFLVDVSTPGDDRRRATAWVNVTRIGLAVSADAGEAWILATDLRNGEPLPEVEVSLGGRVLGTTDARGLLHTGPIPRDSEAPLLVARRGGDVAVLSAHGATTYRGGDWAPPPGDTQITWFVFDDRGLYRPGETAHVKAWVRKIDMGEGGDLQPPSVVAGARVDWILYDAQAVELARGHTTLDGLGGLALDLALPDTPNLGTGWLTLSTDGGATSHPIRIEEFRRPEFEVAARVETPGPHLLGEPVIVEGSATYYAGGGLPGAPARWSVTASPTGWSPPGWDEFRFGTWQPWWSHVRPFGFPDFGTGEVLTGTTDVSGIHRLEILARSMPAPRPYAVTADLSVQDVNRQAWAGRTDFLLHPAAHYVGVRPSRGFYEAGQPVSVDVIVVDLDGGAVPERPVVVELVRKRPVWRRGAWEEEDAERHACEITSRATPVTCTLTPEKGGRFDLVATIRDDAGRTNRTTTPIWVSGSEIVVGGEDLDQQEVTLVPDRERYEVGQVAEVLVQAPFAPATGTVSWRRAGIVHHEPIRIEDGDTTLRVPIEEAHIPGLVVQVDLYGSVEVDGTVRPAWASGEIRLPVPPLRRQLQVEVAPAVRRAAPGERTSVEVAVTDADGRPVPGAQVALVAVDEAVLALTGHTIPDPLGVFHPERDAGAWDHHNRRWVLLQASRRDGAATGLGGSVGLSAEETSGFGGGVDLARKTLSAPVAAPVAAEAALDAVGSDAPVALRTDLRADALWLPAVTTGPDGRVRADLPLPDNLTRYRITAVAVDDGRRFGRGEADLTVRLPLMVRPSAPRFLNFGDTAELPVVVQNQTDAPLVVDIALRASNATVDGAAQGGRRVTVPAADRVEVRLPVSTVSAGKAAFQVIAASGPLADAAAFDLPVHTPATTEAFAVHGSLDGARGTAVLHQPIAVPDDVHPQFGGLELTMSTTALQGLTDAVLHLVDYPFACAEQVASRVIAIAALRDVLAAFGAEGLPDAEELQAAVARDVELLVQMQNDDGSWGFWRKGERGDPWATLHVTHALLRAEAAGWAIPDDARRRAVERVGALDRLFDAWWSEDAKRTARAYSVMVRRLAGTDTRDEARTLVRHAGGVERLPLEALGWLLPSLPSDTQAEALRHLRNRATETAATAGWTTAYSERDAAVLLHGHRRTDAVLLDALLQVAPQDDLLPKVAAGLLAHRVAGAWSTTQENAWVLLALRRYFDAVEAVTPDLVARAWLDDGLAAEHRFRGRSTDRVHVEVPMAWLAEQGDPDLVLAREGQGRLYYRLGLRYAPRSLELGPAEHGFSVERRYEAVDDPSDVQRAPDGTWQVRAGARVRVTVTVVAPARRYHVAVVDPLPAGLEALNPDLLVTEAVPPPPSEDGARGVWWWGRWYDHENLRDERVEAFARLLPAGVWTYRYVTRATTPGRFVVPPARAEEMYEPETFGRTGTDVLVVQ